VLINGEPSPTFYPQRGVRQGCPLSPYLFIVVINELSMCLQHHSSSQNIEGITLGPNCPRIHSLLFANDLIICGQATIEEATGINTILQRFCNACGQTPNIAKSSITFSNYTDNQSKMAVKSSFHISNLARNAIVIPDFKDKIKYALYKSFRSQI
jgi:hypothetical protein